MPKKSEPSCFGVRLKEVREAAGLSQADLADKVEFNRFSIAKLEQGVREPTWATVQALAKALGVDCTAFADQAEKPAKPKRRKSDD